MTQLVDTAIDFISEHPAFLALLDAPSATRNPSIRKVIRELLARMFLLQKPSVSPAKALHIGTVTLQLIKGMNELYAESGVAAREPLVQEFKIVLRCYLTSRLGASEPSPRRKKK